MEVQVDGESKGQHVRNYVKVIFSDYVVTVSHEGIIVDQMLDDGVVADTRSVTFDEFVRKE